MMFRSFTASTISSLVCLSALMHSSFASERYFMCGPDEDGCIEGSYQYCFCIPYDEQQANRPYCLDFTNLKCTPLEKIPTCPQSFIYANQGECLATIFQSEPIPACKLSTHKFCLEAHAYICDKEGQLNTCH